MGWSGLVGLAGAISPLKFSYFKVACQCHNSLSSTQIMMMLIALPDCGMMRWRVSLLEIIRWNHGTCLK